MAKKERGISGAELSNFCGQVALGELAVMLVLGVPLFLWLKKSNVLKKTLGE